MQEKKITGGARKKLQGVHEKKFRRVENLAPPGQMSVSAPEKERERERERESNTEKGKGKEGGKDKFNEYSIVRNPPPPVPLALAPSLSSIFYSAFLLSFKNKYRNYVEEKKEKL